MLKTALKISSASSIQQLREKQKVSVNVNGIIVYRKYLRRS